MDTRPNTERGQAVVLIVLAIVALLGFTALAVDGSMIYSDRRYAQSVADSSSLAGGAVAANEIATDYLTQGTWNCSSSMVLDAGNAAIDTVIASVGSNNIELDDDISDHHGVSVVCGNQGGEKYMDVNVDVTVETQTAFAHFIFGDPLVNTVSATTRIFPRKSLAGGFTIVGLDPNAASVRFHGNPYVAVCGGGIFSNGDLVGAGNIDVEVMDVNCDLTDHGIYYHGDGPDCGGFEPCPEHVDYTLSWKDYDPGFTPEELCSRPGANHVDADELPNNLDPGLYCVSGSISLQGSHGDLIGDDVTIVMLDGGITCNGNCDVQISAPTVDSGAYPAVPGLLIYSMASVTLKLNGNNAMYLYGSILVPNADVNMLGTGDEDSFHTQFITWHFEGGGNNNSTYVWDDAVLASKPVELELNR